VVLTTESGFGAIVVSGVLTETHTIYVKALDRAGNEAKSEPVRIRVMHKPKVKKTSALPLGGHLGEEISDQGLAAWRLPIAATVREPLHVKQGGAGTAIGVGPPVTANYLLPLT